MKVLKPGTGQVGWAIDIECTGAGNGRRGCGALLLVEEGDLFKTVSHARNETTHYHTFRCVECGHMTDVDSDDGVRIVPRHIVAPNGVRHRDGGFCRPDAVPSLPDGVSDGPCLECQAKDAYTRTEKEQWVTDAYNTGKAHGRGGVINQVRMWRNSTTGESRIALDLLMAALK